VLHSSFPARFRRPQELIAQAVTLTQPLTVLAPLLQQLPLCRRGADHELLDIRLELHEGVGRATCPITQPLLAELTPLRLLVDGSCFRKVTRAVTKQQLVDARLIEWEWVFRQLRR